MLNKIKNFIQEIKDKRAYKKGIKKLDEGYYKEAEEILSELKDSQLVDREMLFFNLGGALIGQDKLPEGEKYLHQAIEIESEHDFIWATLAEVNLLQRKWDEAEKAINKAIDLEPEKDFYELKKEVICGSDELKENYLKHFELLKEAIEEQKNENWEKSIELLKESSELYNKSGVQKILSEKNSLGQKMKALYKNEEYVENGFAIDGSEEEKLKAVLNLSLNAYLNSGSIVALHCITATHALIVLKTFQKDFNKNIDILTTCIITHLIAAEIGDYETSDLKIDELNWDDLNYKIEEEKDVHAVKLDYTAQVLNNLYPDDRYIVSAAKRLERL